MNVKYLTEKKKLEYQNGKIQTNYQKKALMALKLELPKKQDLVLLQI